MRRVARLALFGALALLGLEVPLVRLLEVLQLLLDGLVHLVAHPQLYVLPHHLLDQLDVVLLREVVGLVAVLPLVAPLLEGVLEPVGEVRRRRRRRLGVVAALAW